MTIKDLRNNGYKVKVLHYRLYNRKKYSNKDILSIYRTSIKPKPDPKGGSTTIIIDSPDGNHFEGESICSKKDNYNKRLGVRIALGRSGIYDYLRTSYAH